MVGNVTDKSTENSPSRVRRKRALIVNLLALAIIGGSFLAFSLAPDNGTRVRNALIATVAPKVEFIWSPNEAPQHFSTDEVNVPVKFQDLLMQLSSTQAATEPDDFQRAMQLARHLVSNKKKRRWNTERRFISHIRPNPERQGILCGLFESLHRIGYLGRDSSKSLGIRG